MWRTMDSNHTVINSLSPLLFGRSWNAVRLLHCISAYVFYNDWTDRTFFEWDMASWYITIELLPFGNCMLEKPILPTAFFNDCLFRFFIGQIKKRHYLFLWIMPPDFS